MLNADICVIGGGPAGSTTGLQLSRLGYRVVLIERSLFPRPHIGESLPPSILPIFDILGIRAAMETAGFLRPGRALIRWGPSEDFWKIEDDGQGFQVDRGRFDQILLNASREAGAAILQPVRAGRPRRTAFGWMIPVSGPDAAGTVDARFLIDASGKHSGLFGSKKRVSAATTALYGYWTGAGIHEPETRVEAGQNAWYWGAPLPDGSVNATVFVDACSCKRRTTTLDQQYRNLLGQSELLKDCLRGSLRGVVQSCDASSYIDDDLVSDTHIRVGEAAFSIDPLSSQGVQAAIQTGIQASITVNTILARPERRELALDFYRARQLEAAEMDRRTSANLYAQVNSREPFWKARGAAPASEPRELKYGPQLSAGCRLRLSPDLQIVSLPVIEGNFVSKGEAIRHPSLERPLAFLGNMAVVPLLTQIREGAGAAAIVEQWSRGIGPDAAFEVLQWFARYGIVQSWD